MAFRTNKTPVLQTKSASGAVATFNTALAMPLPSCNIAVNAWQEGSGDPNPIDNIRPIHGFSEVNATRAGKNQFGGLLLALSFGNGVVNPASYSVDETNKTFTYARPTTNKVTEIYSKFKPNTQYTVIWTAYQTATSGNNNSVYIRYTDGTKLAITVSNTEKQALIFTTAQNKSVEALCVGYGNGNNITAYYDECGIFEGVVAVEDYEPYTGNTYTIQLGQEVYGGVLDLDSGVLTVTQKIENAKNKTWYAFSSAKRNFYTGFSDTNASITEDCPTGKRPVLCNMFKWVLSGMVSEQIQWGGQFNNKNLQVDTGQAEWTLTDWNNFINNNDVIFCYEISEPFDIQLSDIPTLSTIIGNNTIFADTGDVDLTFKDLDIAKRGNFREVFKLPR